MKKLLFMLLLLLMVASVSEATLTYGASYYITNRVAAGSGDPDRDPIYLFISEIEDSLDGTSAIDALLVTGTIGLLESAGDTYYTYLQAGNQSADLTYTLPTAYGTTGYVLSATDAGVMSWVANTGTFTGGAITGDIVMANGIYLQSTEVTAQASAIQVWDTTAVASYTNVLSWLNQGVPDIVLGAATNTVAIVSTGLNVTAAGAITGVTDITADTLSVTTLYENALIAASSGNVALTMDGAGNGTIGIGLTSTGAITLGRATSLNSTLDVAGAATFDGAVTLGLVSGDDITINGDVVDNITLDDDTTDSPSMIFRDAGENDWIFLKANGAGGHLTATSDSGTSSFHIVAGNLEVGTGAPGTAAMDGEDFYVKGDSEFDGAVQFDGLPTSAAGLTVTAAAVNLNVASNFAINVATGSSTGTVTIGGSAAQVINIGDGAAAKTVTLGSSNTTSTTTILGGSNGVNINVNALNDPTNINTGVNTGTVTIGGTGVQTIAIGDGGTGAKTITLGDGASTGSTDILSGTGNLTINEDAGAATTNVGAGTTTGTVTIGGAGIQSINIGIGAAAKTVTIGSTDTTSTTTINSGSGGIVIAGDIAGSGPSTTIVGMGPVLEVVTTTNLIDIAETGSVFTNTGDVDGSSYTLPEASTALGCSYTFAVTVAQTLTIDPADGTDQIQGLTDGAGDAISSAAIGDCITLMAVQDDIWVVVSTNNSANNADAWVDATP